MAMLGNGKTTTTLSDEEQTYMIYKTMGKVQCQYVVEDDSELVATNLANVRSGESHGE